MNVESKWGLHKSTKSDRNAIHFNRQQPWQRYSRNKIMTDLSQRPVRMNDLFKSAPLLGHFPLLYCSSSLSPCSVSTVIKSFSSGLYCRAHSDNFDHSGQPRAQSLASLTLSRYFVSPWHFRFWTWDLSSSTVLDHQKTTCQSQNTQLRHFYWRILSYFEFLSKPHCTVNVSFITNSTSSFKQ